MEKVTNKNILIVTAVFPPEPVVSSNLSNDIAIRLSEQGNKVKVLCPRPTRPSGFKFEHKKRISSLFQIIEVNSYTCPKSLFLGRFLESISFGIKSAKFIRSNSKNIEVIYANTWPLFGQLFAVKAAKKSNIPIYMHVQDLYPESLINKLPNPIRRINYKLLLPIDNYVLRNSKKVITISESMKKHLAKTRKIQSNKISVIYNWQDEMRFNIDKKYESIQLNKKNVNNFFTFMFLGNLSPSASLPYLIECYGKAKLKNSRLIIAGSGSEKNKLLKLSILYPKSKIIFCDAPFEKAPELQKNADILILSLIPGSSKYALPSKIPSYMFSSKPILSIVDEDGEAASIIDRAKCGWTVSTSDKNELIEKFKTLVKITTLELDTMGQNGFNYGLKHFSKENNLKQFTTLINNSR